MKLKNEQYDSQVLSAQLNPHFIYNTFNAIQNLILQKKNAQAHIYLGKLANFHRKTMHAFCKAEHSLREEIELAYLYIELENLRLNNRIIFKDDIQDRISLNAFVPSVLMRPFLERAIAYGLNPLTDKQPILELKIVQHDQQLHITIEDNGIGRESARQIRMRKNNQHQLMGLRPNIDFEHWNPDFGPRVHYTIIDLYDPQKLALGTKVEILVDLN